MFRIKLVAVVASLALVVSCTTWRRQTGPPDLVLAGKSPERVRLSLTNNVRATVYWPEIDGARLVGWTKYARTGPKDAAYPLADIRSMEVRVISKGRTAALVAGAGVTVLFVAAAISLASEPAPIPAGSCPFIYSATDAGWQLDSGTFGGAIMRPLRRTDVDNLDFARPRNGILTLKLANELDEVDHVDAIEVLAVDHERGTTVGPSSEGVIHGVGRIDAPVQAVDSTGRDILSSIRSADGRSWESQARVRDPKSAETRDGIELSFSRSNQATSARLVVDARNSPWSAFLMSQFVAAHGTQTTDWYETLEANPEQATAMQAFLAREAFLRVSVETDRGWVDRGLLWEVGPEVVKRQVIPIDLTGVSGDVVHVRLDAPASFWLVDYVGLDTGVEPSFSVRTLNLRRAAQGRSPDMTDTLARADGRELRLETGDSIELEYDVPPITTDRARSYMVRSTGWYRIHSQETNAPDMSLLDAVMKPGGVAAAATTRMNAALEHVQVTAPQK